MNKRDLSERDICSKFLTPALVSGKWDLMNQVATGKVTEFVIGLPPLAEQKRIVAKVEELMRWCDQLETHLATARSKGAHLLDSTLRQAVQADVPLPNS